MQRPSGRLGEKEGSEAEQAVPGGWEGHTGGFRVRAELEGARVGA